jgi:hypothetical protein
VATAVAGLVTNPQVRSTSRDMTAPVVLASGRERPATDQDAWFPTGGQTSPGHTDAAFPAHSSGRDKQHWPSDTVAGKVLGIAAGKPIAYPGSDPENKQDFRIAIHALKGGAMLRFSVDPARLLKP